MTKNEAIKILHSINLKATETRIKILNCLSDEKHFHTISDIRDHLEDVNLKTIYNNIKLLHKGGIIDSYVFDGISKFSLSDEIIFQKENLLHLINDDEITHFELKNIVFDQIKNNIENEVNSKVSKIKIFVEIKEPKS